MSFIQRCPIFKVFFRRGSTVVCVCSIIPAPLSIGTGDKQSFSQDKGRFVQLSLMLVLITNLPISYRECVTPYEVSFMPPPRVVD